MVNNKIDVFFLIDISGSMTGAPIDSFNICINKIVKLLSSDIRNNGKIRFSINTFNSEVNEVIELDVVENLQLNLTLGNPSGPTFSGKALENIILKINKTTTSYKNEHHSYKKPLLFFVTDGSPSDFHSYRQIINKLSKTQVTLLGCGVGNFVDFKSLKMFSKRIFYLNKFDIQSINFFSNGLSKMILYYLNSGDDNFDSIEMKIPSKPTNPSLSNKKEISIDNEGVNVENLK